MNKTDTFNPTSFEKLKKVEKNYFWFQVRRKWIHDRIKTFAQPGARVLEIGCGTGNVSSFLSKKGYRVTGCDFYNEAIKRSWAGYSKIQADANNLPFKDNSFDVGGLFDVIEHFQNDIDIIKETARVVRKGGIIVLTVPAREELWSNFDEISFHERRYTKEKLRTALSEVNLDVLSINYMFMSLYPIMRYKRAKDNKNKENFRINRFVNIILKELFEIERTISKVLLLPTGTSLIAATRK